MDAYEATRIVFSRIQSLDPENASKIMGLLLIQDHGEKEMIRLAFGPESLVHSVVLKARKDLGLQSPPSAAAAPPFLSRQNSASRLGGIPSPSSWGPSPVFSRTNSANGHAGVNGVVDDFGSSDEFISPNSPYMGAAAVEGGLSGSPSPSPFYGGGGRDLVVDDFQLQDHLAFLNDHPAVPSGLKGAGGGGGELFYSDMGSDCLSPNWGANGHNRRDFSMPAAADIYSDPGTAAMEALGWKQCLYYARGYCKNGSACRFLHGPPDDGAAADASVAAAEEQQQQLFHEQLLRSKSQRLGGGSVSSQLMASAAAFVPSSPTSTKYLNYLLQQQMENRAAASLMLGGGGDEKLKFLGRARMERVDYMNMVNPGSRQIYLTFPADSTFREEDVSNYFSIYGPVQDVRIPYQQKRMFGFVTFVYPETVKLILAKGNPHFVCDARVLVKPYKEKGKVYEKKQQQQQMLSERCDFSSCPTPTGMDSRDQYELQQLGTRMLFSNNQELLLRRKMEEQQAAADLQQAIELQSRRFMGLQLLDLKTRNQASPQPMNTMTSTTITAVSSTPEESLPQEDKSSIPVSNGAETTVLSTGNGSEQDKNTQDMKLGGALNSASSATGSDKDSEPCEGVPNKDSHYHESVEHNLPDSPFASPTKSSFVNNTFSMASDSMDAIASPFRSNGDHLVATSKFAAPSTLDMASSFKSCFFPMPRFSSGHGAVGM